MCYSAGQFPISGEAHERVAREGDRHDPVPAPTHWSGPTLQGEEFVTGQRAMFVRCDYQCAWCDTTYSWVPGLMTFERMAPEQIVGQLVSRSGCRWVTLTGGNPAIYSLAPLIRALKDRRDPYQIVLETRGDCPRLLRLVRPGHALPETRSSGT